VQQVHASHILRGRGQPRRLHDDSVFAVGVVPRAAPQRLVAQRFIEGLGRSIRGAHLKRASAGVQVAGVVGHPRHQLAGDATTANRDRVLAALFAAMFHYVMGIIPKHTFVGQADVSNRTDELFNRFVVLLREHCRTQRSVEFYAAQMGITPKYLSKVIKQSSGQSAVEWIDSYVLLEARAMLKSSHMTIQQIAGELNFPNQSSFGKYFKHLTGMSPSEYQRS